MGLLYNLNEKLDLVLNLARSYRAASLEERFKYIDLGSKVQLGNPSLNPEKGYSADLGVRYWGDKLEMQASVFMNRMTDMIVETDGIFIYHLTEESSIDTLPALIYSNVSKALLYGCDFSLDYHISNGLQVYLNGAYIIGRDTENDTYLPSIPPMNGRFGIAYTYPEVGAINLSLMGAGAKTETRLQQAKNQPIPFSVLICHSIRRCSVSADAACSFSAASTTSPTRLTPISFPPTVATSMLSQAGISTLKQT